MGKIYRVKPSNNSEINLNQTANELELSDAEEIELPQAAIMLNINGGEVIKHENS